MSEGLQVALRKRAVEDLHSFSVDQNDAEQVQQWKEMAAAGLVSNYDSYGGFSYYALIALGREVVFGND